MNTFSELRKQIIQIKNEILKERLLPEERPIYYSQYNTLLKQLADSVANFSIDTNESEDQFEMRLYDAFEILDDIRSALIESEEINNDEIEDEQDKYEYSNKEAHELWSHGNIYGAFHEGFESKHSKKIDKEWLTQQAIKYLHRPWMENELMEWIIVDSLMFGEISGFGESIKQYSPTKFLNINPQYYVAKGNIDKMDRQNIKKYFETLTNKIIGFVAVPFLIGFYSYHKFSKEWVVLASIVYFSLLSISLLIRKTYFSVTRKYKKEVVATNDNIELFGAMFSIYEILKSSTISPTYLRDRLIETSRRGAVWPSAVLMIVDHAVNRNPAIWNAPESLKYRKH